MGEFRKLFRRDVRGAWEVVLEGIYGEFWGRLGECFSGGLGESLGEMLAESGR